nr:hypothetical protein BACY1_31770 [Tenacibaculum mesophilum]
MYGLYRLYEIARATHLLSLIETGQEINMQCYFLNDYFPFGYEYNKLNYINIFFYYLNFITNSRS